MIFEKNLSIIDLDKGDLLAKVVNTDNALLNEAIESSVSSQSSWKSMSLTDRGQIIYKFVALLY